MSAIASITLAALVSLPQGGDQAQLSSTLSNADKKSLNKQAQDWIKAEIDYEENSRLRRRRDQARDKFKDNFLKKSKDEDLLKHMGDMLAIFDKAFPYEKPRGATPGVFKKFEYETEEATYEYHLIAPRRYDAKNSYRSVLVLAGLDKEKDEWFDPEDYFEKYWEDTEAEKDTIFALPGMIVGDDYDETPDLTSDLGLQNETNRTKGALLPFGEVKRLYRMDRARTLLDCGAGNSGFGLRLATYFPTQFAGVILREPTALGGLRLDSLTGMPVLLVKTDDTAEACEEIKGALDKLQSGKAVVVDGNAENLNEQVDTWLREQVRPTFPTEVTIAPNHDGFGRRAFWAQIIYSEPLDSVSEADRPILNVKMDRENNKVLITSKSVNDIGLYLNDSLLDLDKPVEFIVNGESMGESQFQRNLTLMVNYMRVNAYDASALYSAFHRFEVPKSSGDK